MEKENLDEEFKKLWNETPASHSDEIKKASEEFQSKTLLLRKESPGLGAIILLRLFYFCSYRNRDLL